VCVGTVCFRDGGWVVPALGSALRALMGAKQSREEPPGCGLRFEEGEWPFPWLWLCVERRGIQEGWARVSLSLMFSPELPVHAANLCLYLISKLCSRPHRVEYGLAIDHISTQLQPIIIS
jgi:hypothetical protein